MNVAGTMYDRRHRWERSSAGPYMTRAVCLACGREVMAPSAAGIAKTVREGMIAAAEGAARNLLAPSPLWEHFHGGVA